jgi:hypothetical protein
MQIKDICNIKRNSKLVAIDHGFYGTKIKTEDKVLYIRSKYEKSNNTLNKNNTYHLVYNDTDYIVGEGAEVNSIDYDKTSDELYKIITLAALSMISDSITDYTIMCSYPLTIFNTNKDLFSKYIKGESEYNTKLDDINKSFNIIDTTVFPQGVAHAYSHPKHFLNKTSAILDFGSLTINAVILNSFNIVPGTGFTENLGSIILENNIKKNLDMQFCTNIQSYELPDIIKYGLKYKGKILPKSQDIINDTIIQHMNNIKKVMKSNNWNVESLDLVITGGSSITYKNFLEHTFPQAIFSDDSVNDGANGLFYIGKLLYNV